MSIPSFVNLEDMQILISRFPCPVNQYIVLEQLEVTYRNPSLVSNICVHATSQSKQPIAITTARGQPEVRRQRRITIITIICAVRKWKWGVPSRPEPDVRVKQNVSDLLQYGCLHWSRVVDLSHHPTFILFLPVTLVSILYLVGWSIRSIPVAFGEK